MTNDFSPMSLARKINEAALKVSLFEHKFVVCGVVILAASRFGKIYDRLL